MDRSEDPRVRIVQKAANDDAFRQELLTNAKATLSKELGVPVPDNVKVVVVEDAADTVYLVLPPRQSSHELSETELQAVAGGGGCNWNGTWTGCTF